MTSCYNTASQNSSTMELLLNSPEFKRLVRYHADEDDLVHVPEYVPVENQGFVPGTEMLFDAVFDFILRCHWTFLIQ